ncbi:MAG: phosphate ABC transporter permease PstA [Actinomycetota bacterium]|nr:phosphate ABC transporter permease PstA [Actinomycetota bacterium]
MSVAEATLTRRAVERASRGEEVKELVFRGALLLSVSVAFVTLGVLLVDVAVDGGSRLSLDFLTSFPSRISPERSGIESAIVGTLLLMVTTAAFIVPVGVATAVYLEEYADRDRWWNRLIEVNIQNLAAVPSVVYGILGLAFIVRDPLALGPVVMAGALTLGLLVLPVVIVVSREAIRAVPSSIREGSMALGATQWQTIWRHTLPGALPGIATGVILALSRAIGETAPLIVIGAAAFTRFNPNDVTTDQFTALPLTILRFVTDADSEFKLLGAAAILVLLAILIAMNAGAVYLRNRYEQKW